MQLATAVVSTHPQQFFLLIPDPNIGRSTHRMYCIETRFCPPYSAIIPAMYTHADTQRKTLYLVFYQSTSIVCRYRIELGSSYRYRIEPDYRSTAPE